MQLSDKTVIVTGAGSGLGRAMAIGFCADGAQVFGIARNEAELAETARLCRPGAMHAVVGDVSRPEDVQRLFDAAHGHSGKVDILVNNAALYPKQAFLAMSHDDWRRVIDVNVIGLALCCRHALPGMLERGFGRIVNLGSFAWRGPIPNSSAYSVSKGAVGPLTKALAVEIDRERHPDVLINQLMPGIFKTGMSESGDDPASVYPHVRFVATLPRGGPSGETFVQSTLYVEQRGRRSRLKQLVKRALGLNGRP